MTNDKWMSPASGFRLPGAEPLLKENYFLRFEKAASGAAFRRTRAIGFSQARMGRGGWFVADGVFESIVGDERWELLWQGGGEVCASVQHPHIVNAIRACDNYADALGHLTPAGSSASRV